MLMTESRNERGGERAGARATERGAAMIERTVLDLRIADHRHMAERANRDGWARGAPRRGGARPLRTALAGVLAALARRLDPGTARGATAAA
jgi:hypothetical protein